MILNVWWMEKSLSPVRTTYKHRTCTVMWQFDTKTSQIHARRLALALISTQV